MGHTEGKESTGDGNCACICVSIGFCLAGGGVGIIMYVCMYVQAYVCFMYVVKSG